MTLTHFPNTHMHMATWGVGKNLQRDFSAPRGTGSQARPPRSGTLPPVPAHPRRGTPRARVEGGQPARGQQTQAVRMHSVKKRQFCFLVSCLWFYTGAAESQVPRWLTWPPRDGGFPSAWKQRFAPSVIRLAVGRESNQGLNRFQKHPKCLCLQQNTSGIVVIDDNTKK